MLCEKPYQQGGQVFSCGGCLPCRINRRRIWAHRLELEALNHKASIFLTLTYASQNLRSRSGIKVPECPQTETLASLQPDDLRNWLKRYRKAIAPKRIRFFAVGEYGHETWRPHYHVALFGIGPCWNLQTKKRAGRSIASECCPVCRVLQSTWNMGDIDAGVLEPNSCAYIANYVTKKLTSDDDQRLAGRHPEFARMSNRPGIGKEAMHEVASTVLSYETELPSSLRHGKKQKPLGRYLRNQLSVLCGHDQEKRKEVEKSIREEEL